MRRDVFLCKVRQEVPALYRQAYQAYGTPSELFYHGDISNNVISSAEGVQQGDPLGPFLFSLGINGLVKSMKSSANLWYLDDGCIAGPPDEVLADVLRIRAATQDLGLNLNTDKCELCFLGTQKWEGPTSRARKPLSLFPDKGNLTRNNYKSVEVDLNSSTPQSNDVNIVIIYAPSIMRLTSIALV